VSTCVSTLGAGLAGTPSVDVREMFHTGRFQLSAGGKLLGGGTGRGRWALIR
jgi:hypothetical protein